MLTARTKTIERTCTGRQFPPSLASLSATKFSLQIYMELTGIVKRSLGLRGATASLIDCSYIKIAHSVLEKNCSLIITCSNMGSFSQIVFSYHFRHFIQ